MWGFQRLQQIQAVDAVPAERDEVAAVISTIAQVRTGAPYYSFVHYANCAEISAGRRSFRCFAGRCR